MKELSEQFDCPEVIIRSLLNELQMALQHLEHALREKSPVEGRRYYLVWCDKHIKKAKWLTDILERLV